MKLEVTGLCVAYGRIVAVHSLDLSIAGGEAVSLLGPNGAGKSSAVEAIAGLLPKSGGTVVLDGRSITRSAASAIARRGLAIVPQRRELFAGFSVEENLLTARRASQGRTPLQLDAVYELFPALATRRSQLAGTLSGGEQQMVAIGRALVTSPGILVLDEPSAGLAAGVVATLVDAIARVTDSGVALLLVEQNLDIARALTTKAVVLAAGAVTWQGRMDEALSHQDITEAYFG